MIWIEWENNMLLKLFVSLAPPHSGQQSLFHATPHTTTQHVPVFSGPALTQVI